MITDEQRKAFEQWATNKGFNVTRFNDYPQYMYDNTYFAWEAWKAAQQVEPAHDEVPMPQNADQAQLMALVAESWLKHNAPERLKEPAQAVPVGWLDEEFMQAYTIAELADADGAGFKPLYTHPAPLDSDTRKRVIDFVRWIESLKTGGLIQVRANDLLKLLEANNDRAT